MSYLEVISFYMYYYGKTFYIKTPIALPERLASIPEVEMNKSIEPGCPIVLQCELSDPTAEVSWYKDGIELSPQVGIDMLSHGNSRTLSVRSAELCHTGVYSCKIKDNVIHFNVDIKGDFSAATNLLRLYSELTLYFVVVSTASSLSGFALALFSKTYVIHC